MRPPDCCRTNAPTPGGHHQEDEQWHCPICSTLWIHVIEESEGCWWEQAHLSRIVDATVTDRDSTASDYVRRRLDLLRDHLPAPDAEEFIYMLDCVLIERSLGWTEVDKQGKRADRAETQINELRMVIDRLTNAVHTYLDAEPGAKRVRAGEYLRHTLAALARHH